MGAKIERLRAQAGRAVPGTVLHVGPAEPTFVAGYAELDVERVVFPVDTAAADPLAALDHPVATTIEITREPAV